MSSLVEMLTSQLQGGGLRQISEQLGADEGATATAVSSALPVLIGALSKNSANQEGAAALLGALKRDHDGSALGDLTGLIRDPESRGGSGILRHVLGGQQAQVEVGLSQASGLDAGSAGKLLAMLAPLVMGALGKAQRQGGLDISDLSGMLAGERQQAKAALPGAAGMLSSFLDADGDGDIKDDVARMGAGLLGKLFSGNR